MNCKDNQSLIIDYIEETIEEDRKIAIESHLIECESCRETVQKLQKIVNSLEKESDSIEVPVNFMSNVRNKVNKTKEVRRKTKKSHAVMGLVASLFFTMFVGTAVATNNFATVIDWWKDFSNKQNEQVQESIRQGIGENLNLEVESNGLKVKIKSVVADDIQTLIYYEVEDTSKENKYMFNFTEGLEITNQNQDWSFKDSPFTSHISLYSASDYIFNGRLRAAPMTADEGSIQLELSKLEKVINPTTNTDASKDISALFDGFWSFDIPVKKHPAIVHDIQVETEIDGNPVIFDKLTIAPTTTTLSYRYRNENSNRRMEYINIASLESNGKHVVVDRYSGSGGSADGWNSEEVTFESIYFDKPTDIRIHIGSALFSVQEQAQFTVDTTKGLPQTFEYLGNNIAIEKITIGNQTRIEMTEELSPDRVYETLNYRFLDKDGQGSFSASVDGYLIDKDGEKYKASENFYRYDDLENPRFFSTMHDIEVSTNNKDRQYIPVSLEIEGYSVTTFYDTIIDLSLD